MTGTVLVVGASGLVGTAASLAFLDSGWEVVVTSRRVPGLLDGRNCTFVPLDLLDPEACRAAAGAFCKVTHVVYTAVFELPGLVAGWSDPLQIETNGQMLRNLLEPLAAVAQLKHVTLLQGTKAYGPAVQPMRVPARESQPRVEHPNFYWLQEDYLKEKSGQCGFDVTIFRPQLIVGPNHGVVMNLPPVIGAYAALRRKEGLPFSFPGGEDHVWEAVDVRLVANACVWAAHDNRAKGETFNLTNGEVFMWRDLWPALAETLGVAVGPDERLSVAEYLNARESLWDEVVAEHGLEPVALNVLVGESHHYADLCFGVYGEGHPRPTAVSTVKVKQAGFTDTWNTEESFCYWLRDLQARRVLPTF